MVLSDHTKELVQEVGGLVLGQAVDVLDMVTESKEGLPASDGVGANNRVLSRQLTTNVQGGATRILVKLELMVLSSLSEEGLSIGGGETVQELLVGGREAIIDFITGSPESIY